MAGELNLGSLIYELGFEDEQAFLRALDRTLDRAEDRSERSGREAGQGFSRGMSRFIGSAALGGLIGGAATQAFGMASQAVGSFVSDLDRRAVEIQSNMRKATAVFAETLPTVQRWAEENANALGLTSQEAVSLAASAQDLLVPMGFVREEAADISTTLVGLSGALAEWSGGQRSSAEVSDILTKALLGERDSLKSLGISISAADVEARLAAKGQAELEGAVRQQAEAQATLELILEKSSDAQAAYAEGSGTLARQQAEATAAFNEAKDALAVELIPVMQSFYTDVAPALVAGVGQAIELFRDWKFIITGTTDELARLEEQQRRGFIAKFGQEAGQGVYDAGERMEAAMQGVQDAQSELERLTARTLPTFGHEKRLDEARARLKEAQGELETSRTLFQESVRQANVRVEPLPLLNTSSAAPSMSSASSTSTTPTRTRTSAARTTTPRDPLIDEAGRVGADLRRLQSERDLDLLNAQAYEEAIEAHLRRLMGLYERATTSEQAAAILAPAQTISNELRRIEEDAVSANEDLMRQQYQRQQDLERSVSERARAERERLQAEREETAARNEDLMRRQYERQQALEQGVTQAAARQVQEREAARVKRLGDAEAEARFLAQLEDRTQSEQADALGRILDESELNAEERLRLEREVQLLRARAADEAADAIIQANQREAREIEANTRRAQAEYRQRQDLEVEGLRLSDQAREADLLAAKNALDRALQDLGDNLALRAALQETYKLSVSDINARYDEQELSAEQQRIQTIIQGEGELTEAKRLALMAQLEQELSVLQASEDANLARITAVQEALGTLGGQKGVDLTRLEADLTNVALSFPRALASGVKDGDVGGALKGALGSASDFFVEQMIQGILGPIAQNLAKSVAGGLGGGGGGGGFNPLSLVLGIGLPLIGGLLGGLFGGKPKPAAQRASESRASSGSPSITYQASTTLNFSLGTDLKDPTTLAEIRALAREETLSTLEQLGRLKT